MPQKPAQKRNLSRKQEAFILAMCESSTIGEACAAVEISDDTARRWMRIPEVSEALAAARREIFNQALSGLMIKVEAAIDTLSEVMKDKAAPHPARIRAAQVILTLAIDAFKTSEIEQLYEQIKPFLKRGE